MVGGNPMVFDAVRPVLEVLGRPTWVGPSGSGQLAKLALEIERRNPPARVGMKPDQGPGSQP